MFLSVRETERQRFPVCVSISGRRLRGPVGSLHSCGAWQQKTVPDTECWHLAEVETDVFTWSQSGSAHGRGVGRSSRNRQVVVHLLYLGKHQQRENHQQILVNQSQTHKYIFTRIDINIHTYISDVSNNIGRTILAYLCNICKKRLHIPISVDIGIRN